MIPFAGTPLLSKLSLAFISVHGVQFSALPGWFPPQLVISSYVHSAPVHGEAFGWWERMAPLQRQRYIASVVTAQATQALMERRIQEDGDRVQAFMRSLGLSGSRGKKN